MLVSAYDDPFHRIDRMDWAGPNEFRSSSGEPGPAYWQQRADYTITATLDTARKTIRGTVSIHYVNNSPDSLRFVWLQLDQNLYRTGSKGSSMFPAESRWGVLRGVDRHARPIDRALPLELGGMLRVHHEWNVGHL